MEKYVWGVEQNEPKILPRPRFPALHLLMQFFLYNLHSMMTTLHGLVTISELFAGFNLINTDVVNCLIMCQNARKIHYSEA